MMHTFAARSLLAVAIFVLVSSSAISSAQTQTASEFYMAYRAAFAKAKTIEELFPYMSKATRSKIEATPAADRPKMFEMVKGLNTLTNVKILKEAKTADGATITAEGLDSDKSKTTGTIEIVREDGAWKVGRERWSSSS